MASYSFQPDAVIDGRYKLVQLLGEGTFAFVWYVWDKRFNRYGVLKILKPNIKGPVVRRRVIAEARIMASLWTSGHPHRDRIAEVRDVSDEDAEVLYIALEVVDGGDLQQKLLSEKPSVHAALSMFLLILHGVQVAHERALEGEAAPVIHRDLKPGNVLLTKLGMPKVTDFGIANAAHTMTEDGVAAVPFGTTAGKREGTLGYAAPEQMSDASSVDVRCDLYALGVILAVMVADFDPGDKGDKLLYEEELQEQVLRDVPEDIRAAIVKAVHAQRTRRFQNIREFIAAVEVLIEAHPDTGGPAWTLRPGRTRPAATPTPKPPDQGVTPDAPPNAAAVPASSEPEGRGPLFTEVGDDDGAVETAVPPADPFDDPEPTPRKRSRGWVVGVIAIIAVIAVIGIGAAMLRPDADPVSAETTVEALAPTTDTRPPTPDPVEAKVEAPVLPITPVVEPKLEVKTEAKAEVRPKAEAKPKAVPEKPKVEAPKAEDPKPTPVMATTVTITNPVNSAKAGDSIVVNVSVVLPEGESIASANIRWRIEGQGAQSKLITVSGGKASGSFTPAVGEAKAFTYWVDVRATSAPGKAIKSNVTTVTVTQ